MVRSIPSSPAVLVDEGPPPLLSPPTTLVEERLFDRGRPTFVIERGVSNNDGLIIPPPFALVSIDIRPTSTSRDDENSGSTVREE